MVQFKIRDNKLHDMLFPVVLGDIQQTVLREGCPSSELERQIKMRTTFVDGALAVLSEGLAERFDKSTPAPALCVNTFIAGIRGTIEMNLFLK